jgi:hypothetical protein
MSMLIEPTRECLQEIKLSRKTKYLLADLY